MTEKIILVGKIQITPAWSYIIIAFNARMNLGKLLCLHRIYKDNGLNHMYIVFAVVLSTLIKAVILLVI